MPLRGNSSKASSAQLVFEVGTEELPPAAVRNGLRQMREVAPISFHDARIPFERLSCFGTPRRLVLIVDGVVARQADLVRDVRGPAVRVAFTPDGKPTNAAQGFARAQGVAVTDLETRDTPEGNYVYVVNRQRGRFTSEVLRETLPALVQQLTFAKSMRWGTGSMRFARPIRWVLALLGSKVLRLELAGLQAGRRTYAHRVLHPNPISVRTANAYREALHDGFVLLDPEERRERITSQCFRVTYDIGGQPILDPDLLEEIIQIVEWPTVFKGRIADEFLSLPRDVLVTVMQHHQKYFAVQGAQGDLLPLFLAVRDGDARGLETVKQGNEWVLKARLSDAKFFFDEDRQRRLSSRVAELNELTFHEKLGTMWEKTRRLEALALLAPDLFDANSDEVRHLKRAAHLSKADLVTLMVRELPELQGTMGELYAKHDGEPEPVARGIGEQYLPRGQTYPRTDVGTYLALLDKADTLIGALAAGLTVSGSEDPYGFRRAANGIVQIILFRRIHFSARRLVSAVLDVHGLEDQELRNSVSGTALDLLLQRFRTEMTLQQRGLSYDTVDAVLASASDDLTDAEARAWALQVFRNRPEFLKLYTAFDRASRILPSGFAGEIRDSLLTAPAEVQLLDALRNPDLLKTADRVSSVSSWKALNANPNKLSTEKAKDYSEILQRLAALAGPVDRFFNDVLVMDQDMAIRNNRLALLSQVVQLGRLIADFSLLVVSDAAREGKPSPVPQR